jgi:RNA polymerase sigma-70 factor, ECF subfamily
MPPTTDLTDIQLMLRVRKDKEAAFAELHARYQRKVLDFFWGLSRNRHLANDLCQEAFLRIWKVRRRYRATGSFAGYLFGIARLVWLESLRDARKQQRLGARQPWEYQEKTLESRGLERPDARARRAEMETEIHRALADLPEEQRMVFLMRTVQGLSLAEIAEALDCPVNTVRSRKILAIRKLRHVLRQVFETSDARRLQEYR